MLPIVCVRAAGEAPEQAKSPPSAYKNVCDIQVANVLFTDES
jgi:hypothetical protein